MDRKSNCCPAFSSPTKLLLEELHTLIPPHIWRCTLPPWLITRPYTLVASMLCRQQIYLTTIPSLSIPLFIMVRFPHVFHLLTLCAATHQVVLVNGTFPRTTYPSAILDPLTVKAYDYFGNFVEADSTTLVTFEPEDGSVTILSNQKTLKNGVAVFDTMTLTGHPSTNKSIRMGTNLDDSVLEFKIGILLNFALLPLAFL